MHNHLLEAAITATEALGDMLAVADNVDATLGDVDVVDLDIATQDIAYGVVVGGDDMSCGVGAAEVFVEHHRRGDVGCGLRLLERLHCDICYMFYFKQR